MDLTELIKCHYHYGDRPIACLHTLLVHWPYHSNQRMYHHNNDSEPSFWSRLSWSPGFVLAYTNVVPEEGL